MTLVSGQSFWTIGDESSETIRAFVIAASSSLDINKNTSRKLAWMMEVGLAIDKSDPSIVSFCPSIFEQVSKEILNLSESSRYLIDVRVLNHVIKSLQLA